MLEDFVMALAEPSDALIPPVDEFLRGLPPTETRFLPCQLPKARVHTWLAIQREPGKPLGLAITKRYLDPRCATGVNFMRWFASVGEMKLVHA